ncbi:MAG: hypothetical protein AAF544_12955 [Bacteroidota bacterium]
MFSAPRFIRYLRWLWLRSPSWYLAAPFAAATVFALFFYFTIGPESTDFSHMVPRFNLEAVMPWVFSSFIFGSVFTAIHLASRHLANDEEAVSFMSLPVSTLERWLGSLFGVLVAIPLFSYISIAAFYLLLGLFRGLIKYPFPDFGSVLPLLSLGLVSYYVMAPLAFAIGVLKPKRAVVWYILVGIIIMVALPVTVSSLPEEQVLIDIPETPSPSNLVGLFFQGSYTESSLGFALGSKVGFLVPSIVAALAFIAVHYIGLRHKQV